VKQEAQPAARIAVLGADDESIQAALANAVSQLPNAACVYLDELEVQSLIDFDALIVVFSEQDQRNEHRAKAFTLPSLKRKLPAIAIPVWNGDKTTMPPLVAALSIIFFNSGHSQSFETEISALLSEKADSLHDESNYSSQAFTKTQTIPCYHIEQAEDNLQIHGSPLVSILLVMVFSAIVHFIYSKQDLLTIAKIGESAFMLAVLLTMFCIWQVLRQGIRICFSPPVAILTPGYFLYRGKAPKTDKSGAVKGWRVIPTAEIASFDARPFTFPWRWQARELVTNKFPTGAKSSPQITVKLNILFDEVFIAKLLNGQLLHYRPVFSHFVPEADHPRSCFGRKFKRLLTTLVNLWAAHAWCITLWQHFWYSLINLPNTLKHACRTFCQRGFWSKLGTLLWLVPVWFLLPGLLILVIPWTVITVGTVLEFFGFVLATLFAWPITGFLPIVLLVLVRLLIPYRQYNAGKLNELIDDRNYDRVSGDFSGLFLSYKHEDAALTLRLTHALKQAGVPVWLDRFEIFPGDNWFNKVKLGLAEKDVIGVVVSKLALESPFIRQELKAAVDLKGVNLKILPILIEDVELPDFLVQYPCIDLRQEQNYNAAFQSIAIQLRQGIKADTGSYSPDLSIESPESDAPEQWKYTQRAVLRLKKTCTKGYESTYWHLLRWVLLVLTAGLIHYLLVQYSYPDSTLDMAGQVDIYPHEDGLTLLENRYVFAIIVAAYLAYCYVWPKTLLSFDRHAITISKTSLNIADIAYFSSRGLYLYPHYFASRDTSTLPHKILLFAALGDVQVVEMSLNGWLVHHRGQQGNAKIVGKSRIDAKPFEWLVFARDSAKIADKYPEFKQTPITDSIFGAVLAMIAFALMSFAVITQPFLIHLILYFAVLAVVFLAVKVSKILLPLAVIILIFTVVSMLSTSVFSGKDPEQVSQSWFGDKEQATDSTPSYPAYDQMISTQGGEGGWSSGAITFDEYGKIEVTFTDGQAKQFTLDRYTGWGTVKSRFGRPSYISRMMGQNITLHYLSLGLTLEFRDNKFHSLNIYPDGHQSEVEVDNVYTYKQVSWRSPILWTLGEYPLVAFATNAKAHTLNNRQMALPKAYLLDTRDKLIVASCQSLTAIWVHIGCDKLVLSPVNKVKEYVVYILLRD
jgi:hypothetical protein